MQKSIINSVEAQLTQNSFVMVTDQFFFPLKWLNLTHISLQNNG